jgi:hypothetical protein
VDRDNDDCKALKKQLDEIAIKSDLNRPRNARPKGKVRVLNRIAIEELEAWFFGDVKALSEAFPRVPETLGNKQGFRHPDAISGGTWERLEGVLKRAGYYSTGMPKTEVAREVARRMDPARNRSRSFQVFRDGLVELCAS